MVCVITHCHFVHDILRCNECDDDVTSQDGVKVMLIVVLTFHITRIETLL